jgi:exopolysaccharide biosynthesis predicted pyruvyltransferase EpsI
MPPHLRTRLGQDAAQLLAALGDFSDLTFLRSWGNRGDDLIYAGLRRLIRDLPYREFPLRDNLDKIPYGDTAIVSGGGAWCRSYHAIAGVFTEIEKHFRRVVLFPSSFDLAEPSVASVLAKTKAVIFARERCSYEQICNLCDARLALDTAFFFDFDPYRDGFSHGVLNAFRNDSESTGAPIPSGNRDISLDCATLDEFLWTISRHDLIRTDRAHVIIAAVMLGKQVEFRPSSYHKVPAMVDFYFEPGRVRPLNSSDLARVP